MNRPFTATGLGQRRSRRSPLASPEGKRPCPGFRSPLDDALQEFELPGQFGGSAVTVPSDERRRPLKKAEYLLEHFTTGGTPVGHGFSRQNIATGMGNYTRRAARAHAVTVTPVAARLKQRPL